MIVHHHSPTEMCSFIVLPGQPKINTNIKSYTNPPLIISTSMQECRILDYRLKITDDTLMAESLAHQFSDVYNLPFKKMTFDYPIHSGKIPQFKVSSVFCSELKIPDALAIFIHYALLGDRPAGRNAVLKFQLPVFTSAVSRVSKDVSFAVTYNSDAAQLGQLTIPGKDKKTTAVLGIKDDNLLAYVETVGSSSSELATNRTTHVIWKHPLVYNIMGADLIKNGQYNSIVLYVLMEPADAMSMRAMYADYHAGNGHNTALYELDYPVINFNTHNDFCLSYGLCNPWLNTDIYIVPILHDMPQFRWGKEE